MGVTLLEQRRISNFKIRGRVRVRVHATVRQWKAWGTTISFYPPAPSASDSFCLGMKNYRGSLSSTIEPDQSVITPG